MPDSTFTIDSITSGFSILNTGITLIITVLGFIVSRLDINKKMKKIAISTFLSDIDKAMESLEGFMCTQNADTESDQKIRQAREFVIGRADSLRVNGLSLTTTTEKKVDDFILKLSDLTYEKDSEKIGRSISQLYALKNSIRTDLLS